MTVKRKLSELAEPEVNSSKRNCKFKNLFTILLSKMNRSKTNQNDDEQTQDKQTNATDLIQSPDKTTSAMIRPLNGKSCCNCELVQKQTQEGMDCSFCERFVCCGCVRQCDRCTDLFCSFCSIKNYDTAQERAFCHSCY